MRTVKTLAIAVTIAALGASCASVPIEDATEQMGRAKAALQSALANDADDLAPVLFRNAQNKMARAERAMANREREEAIRLAQQVEADALLAATQADLNRAESLAKEIEDGVDALERELEMNND